MCQWEILDQESSRKDKNKHASNNALREIYFTISLCLVFIAHLPIFYIFLFSHIIVLQMWMSGKIKVNRLVYMSRNGVYMWKEFLMLQGCSDTLDIQISIFHLQSLERTRCFLSFIKPEQASFLFYMPVTSYPLKKILLKLMLFQILLVINNQKKGHH